jgi:hypothetical protein
MHITILCRLALLLLLLGCQAKSVTDHPAQEQRLQGTELSIGSKQFLSSRILEEDRPIIISLPEGYHDSDAYYPVLYLTDGLQNIWHVIGAVELLTRTGSIPPLIVVGIESVDRMRDFTMTAGQNFPGSGGGEQFFNFIKSELIPHIDSSYRTKPFKVLEGHSLGGLFTAATLMKAPGLFDGYIIMSPSFWWNGEELTQKAAPFFKTHPELEKALFFGIGTYESGAEYGMRKELKNFVAVLAEHQPEKLRFSHREMENEGHMSSPLLSNYYGLKFIFSDMAFPEHLSEAFNKDAFLEHEERIMAKYGRAAKQSAEAYVSLALNLRESGSYADAITVLERSVAAYPFDVHLLNFLAGTYELDHKIEEAVSVYQKAIEISKKYNYKREAEFAGEIRRLRDQ